MLSKYYSECGAKVYFISWKGITAINDEEIDKYWFNTFNVSCYKIMTGQGSKIVITDETQNIYDSHLPFGNFLKQEEIKSKISS